MIGHFLQKLHQGVDPAHSMMNKGGGGGSSTPYYASQDRLFGTQADIAQNLYNQYANLAPNYLSNTSQMVDEAMDGTLANKMREQAGNDAAAANGASWAATNRSMQRMGANFSTDRMLSEANRNSIMGAANMTNAQNNATRAAEDAKWNMNAGAYGQISGMGTGAMQGLGSAASGYGQMSSTASHNDAMNSAGWGKFGANIAGGMFAADGGYISKPGLHLAYGGPVSPFKNYLTPVNYQSRPVDQYNGGSMGINPLVALGGLGLAAMYKDELKGLGKRVKGGLGSLFNGSQDKTPSSSQVAGWDYGSTPVDTPSVVSLDAGDSSWDGYSGYSADPEWYANGGYVPQRGLRLAQGGYLQPVTGQYDTDPYRFRQQGPGAGDQALQFAQSQAVNTGLNRAGRAAEGSIKSAFNSASDAAAYDQAADRINGAVGAAPELAEPNLAALQGVTEAAPEAVADGANAAANAADYAEGAMDGLDGASSAVPYAGIAKAAFNIANGEDVGQSVGKLAAGYGGSEAGAALGTAVMPGVGTAIGGVLGGLLGGSLFSKGGDVQGRGLRKNMKPGGKVAGPGTETSDDIPAWLSDGEYVLNAEAVKLIGREKLDALNQRGLQMRGQGEEAAEGHPGVKDSPAEEKREARGLKGGKKAPPAKGKGMKLAKGGNVKKGC